MSQFAIFLPEFLQFVVKSLCLLGLIVLKYDWMRQEESKSTKSMIERIHMNKNVKSGVLTTDQTQLGNASKKSVLIHKIHICVSYFAQRLRATN